MARVLAIPAALLLALLPAAASSSPEGPASALTVVESGDADARANLQTVMVTAGFVDADGDRAFDVTAPNEALYLDMNGNGIVDFGDIRLVPFANYPAGSAVDYTNRDFDRWLVVPGGWFARDARHGWLFDTDGSGTTTPGDVRLSAQDAGRKVTADDGDLGEELSRVQEGVTPALRVGWADANGDLLRDPVEPVYVDLDLNGEVTPGEPRLAALGFAVDDEATRTELDSAVVRLEAQDGDLRSGLDALDGRTGAWNTTLLILALLNLGLLAGMGYWVWKIHQRTQTPSPGRAGETAWAKRTL